MVRAWSRALGRGGGCETALSVCLCKAPELGGSWDGATGWMICAKGEEQNLRDLFIWHQALSAHASFVKMKAAVTIKSDDFMGGHLGEAWYRRKKLLKPFVSLILICWWPESGLVLWTPLPPSFLLKQLSVEVSTKLDLLLPSLVITLSFTFMQRQTRVCHRPRARAWFSRVPASTRPDPRKAGLVLGEGKAARSSRNSTSVTSPSHPSPPLVGQTPDPWQSSTESYLC